MTTQQLLGAGIGLAAVALWFLAYGVALLATRPARPQPMPATQDLGPNPEPPAVVSLLANYWDITEDAAEATLLDLGARKILEFRQPANDPWHTTVHVKVAQPTGLNPYEQRIFQRVSGLAVGGVVPLTALTFRDAEAAKGFAKRLRAEVTADARLRGLSRRRLGKPVVTALVVAAAVTGAAVALAAGLLADPSHDDNIKGILGVGVMAWVVLSGIAGRGHGERDTEAGRAAAARWLGVKTWLQNTESFGDLPPSAVAVWDRYLAYGAAVGATRVSSAVIDLGMGNRRNVWSSFGGTWHRVRVRYPRIWRRYGQAAPPIVARALLAGGVSFLLLRYWAGLVGQAATEELGGRHNPVGDLASPVKLVGLTIGLVLGGYALYMLVRMVIDLAAPATITGQVLWMQVFRTVSGGENSPPRAVFHYLAVDDGTGESTRAWVLPSSMAGQCSDGDTVTITARPWTRRVGEVTVREHGSWRQVERPQSTKDQTENLIAAAMGVPEPRKPVDRPALTGLVTDEEASRAVGYPVTGRPTGHSPAGQLQSFHDQTGQPVLILIAGGGMAASMMLRPLRQHRVLPGIGDEAYTADGWAAGRRGDTVIMLRLHGAGMTVNPNNLYWLLSTAVGRLPASAQPVG